MAGFASGLFGDMFNMPPQTHFERSYRCYSVLMMQGRNCEDVNKGGKIMMPPSALEMLSRLNIMYPMLFRIENHTADRTTHAGVLEFVAEEGVIYLPHWMMQNLLLEEGGLVTVTNATLPVCSYAKFQPQSTDFLDISDQKAVLENTLRSFACLTEGDIIAIQYNNKTYEIAVLEAKPKDPSHSVSIIECDMELDFAAPVGYVEPDYKAEAAERAKALAQEEAARATAAIAEAAGALMDGVAEAEPAAFTGAGHRLDGKAPTTDIVPLSKPSETRSKAPEFNPRKLFFKPGIPRAEAEAAATMDSSADGEFKTFAGKGQTLR